METVKLIFLIMYSAIKSGSSEYIWDGQCGGTSMTRAQAATLWSPFWEGVPEVEHTLRTIVPLHIRPDPTDIDDLVNMNPWLITLFSMTAVPSPLGGAALIRVKPGVDSSDIAVTSWWRCRVENGRYTAVFGARDGIQESGFLRVPVIGCWNHPNMNRKTGENDIAIIKLNASVPLGGRIQAVCLPSHKEALTRTLGLEGTVTGVHLDNGLRQLHLQIVNQALCTPNSDGVLCVDKIKDGTELFGYRDMGAPFVTMVKNEHDKNKYVMLGMVGYGAQHPLIQPFKPTPVLRVAPFLNPGGWLEQMIKNHSVFWN